MNLAELIAVEKQHESELLRAFDNRKKTMKRQYNYMSNLTITENEEEKVKLDNLVKENVGKYDSEIQGLKDKIFAEKETINEANVTHGINILLQKIKFNKIELSYLNLDKYDFGTSSFDTSDKIKKLEIEKVKLMNHVMTLNHNTQI